ncbi:MAG: gamma-glutamyl-gamma-aminobutyrate hydrolase family protein [Acetobacteraceae bacterium]|nr:gamma-glutamyl-gamma-aminobutyrate hydrolase family protein [Acetobacteraceae bacterium]
MSIVVGIPACATTAGERLVHQTPARYADALIGGSSALPIMIPPMGDTQLALLDRIDGLLVPGSPSNVHPSHYGMDESLTPDRHDPARDSTTLPLIRAAIARGLPVLAICRGIQELNVALGGTLLQNIHDLPGRMDHRGGPPPLETAYGPRHTVSLAGALARIAGATEITVNSLHSQAIGRPGDGLVVEALAEDGTIEAVSFPTALGFVLGIQWHPEWLWAEKPASVAIFHAFGEACRAYQQSPGKAA